VSFEGGQDVSETVLYEKRDRIAYVTLNRAGTKNAIDPGMHDELCPIWSDLGVDDGADLAILSGTGDAAGSNATDL
jgi:enoyl-CoA hydratase/carnithine racemase